MTPPTPEKAVEVSEEAKELAAEALWNEREYRDPTGEAPDDWYPPGDNPEQEPPREPFLWEQMVSEGKYEGDQRDYRNDAHAALQAAAPAICAPLEAEIERLKELVKNWERKSDGNWEDARELEVRLREVQAERDQATQDRSELSRDLEAVKQERDQATQQERERIEAALKARVIVVVTCRDCGAYLGIQDVHRIRDEHWGETGHRGMQLDGVKLDLFAQAFLAALNPEDSNG